MDKQKRLAKAWLRYTRRNWLHFFNGSVLSDPAKLLLGRLEEKLKRGENKEAWDLILDLHRLSDKATSKESAEIRLECGLSAAEMDDFRNALKLLNEAATRYKDISHNHAVAMWMVGCTLWMLPNKEIDAIASWQNSLKSFADLRDHLKKEQLPYEWYKARHDEMFQALHLATERYQIPPLPEGADHWEDDLGREEDESAGTAEESDADERESRNGNGFTDRIGVIPFYNQIQAGAFSSSGILETISGHLEAHTFLIDDVPYRAYSLLAGHIVNLHTTNEYYVLKVSGTSMNSARPVRIEDGDYVLMRRQNAADSGDILAAEIYSGDDRDNRATLKRLTFTNGRILLKPESDDPRYSERLNPLEHYTKFDEGFHICGVAVAVLKKIRE